MILICCSRRACTNRGTRDMQGDTAASVEFLRLWSPDGPWVLTAIDPDTKGKPNERIQTRTFSADQSREAGVWIDAWQGKRNLYFTANRVTDGAKKKAKKEQITHALCCHVDIDPATPPDGADPETWYGSELERILPLLTDYMPRPTAIVFSGGGYQGFWKLTEPHEIDDPADIEARNRKIEKDLGGDHCFNVDRIMRLPGTINVPNAKKVAKGRKPALARIVYADWSLTYSLEDLPPLIDEPKALPKGAKPAKEKRQPAPGPTKREVPEWTRRLIVHGPDPEGPRSYGGDRSKAVFAVCCSLVRSGWSDEDIATAISDPANKISGHVLDQSNSAQYALKQAARARDKVGDEFAVNEKGRPVATQHNIRLALAKLDVTVSYNEFSRRAIIEGPHGEEARYYDDDEENRLWLAVDEAFGFRPPFEFFHRVVSNESRINSYHPVREYLDGLSWDGVRRLDRWLIECAGAIDSPYTRAVGAIMLIAAVRRVRRPGTKFDEMMIFESDQGLNKSSALAILAVNDEWFTDSLPLNADDKQIIEILSGKWIVEAGELKGMRGSAIEHLKAFLSRQVDRARLSYGRHVTEVPRQCVIFGTTNTRSPYLMDTTGNRRFWPVPVVYFDIEELRAQRDQLWAEAAQREAMGESVRLPVDLYASAAQEQEQRAVEDPWVNVIGTALNGYSSGRIVSSNMWDLLNIPIGLRTQQHNMRLGESMRVLGWDRVKLRKDGQPIWHYARGSDHERMVEIKIERDPETGGVTVNAYDDGLPLRNNDPPPGEDDIPF